MKGERCAHCKRAMGNSLNRLFGYSVHFHCENEWREQNWVMDEKRGWVNKTTGQSYEEMRDR